MRRGAKRGRVGGPANSRRDPMDYFHDEWLGMVRPIDGLVVAKQALLDAQVARPEASRELRETLEGLLTPLTSEPGLGRLAVTDMTRLFADVLGLGIERWRCGEALSGLSFTIPDTGQILQPTRALVRSAESAPIALTWELPSGLPLDERETVTGAWDYPPAAKLDRLLRHTGVPIGLLTNGTHLRLMYSPHGASTGALTFRFADMVTAAGKPLLDAFVMLLHARQWFSVPPDKQVPRLLAASREAQGKVTKELADQVLEALHILLAGFEAADGGAALNAAYRDPDRGGDHVYAGLLTFMLRLVFVLYAEDNGLLPVDNPLYAQHLSVLGLHAELAADAGAYPDAMGRRYGAYGRLVSVFRAIFFGVSHSTLHMPPRHGELFSPHVYSFLEGVTEPSSPGPNDVDGRRRVTLPLIDDETIYLVLHRLLVLGEERLSYKALDVEQIGSVYEALMGFSVEQLTAPAVCLKKSRTWLTGEQLAAEPAGARGKWIADELGLAKADADRIAKAVGSLRKADAILDALAPFVTTTPPRADAGRYIIQPGTERRRSGSHYTPRTLTAPIVEKTLAPLLAVLGAVPTSEQLLALKICDPAMGSGAFLVETVRQLGDHVVAAWRREGKGGGLLPAHGPAHAADDAVPLARRLVAQRCIYGVDKNPHAVTLAKLSLWLITLAKDKPFTFVDHALRHGDSLVGLDLDQLTAFHWEPAAQVDVVERELRQVLDEAVVARERIVALAVDDSPAAQREKERLLRDASDAVGRLRLIGDLVLGAYFSSTRNVEREAERVRRRDQVAAWLASDRDTVPGELLELARDFRAQIPAFHWMIELPEVFWSKRPDPLNQSERSGKAWIDGFVGNPPFAGKNNVLAMDGGEALLEWLKQVHPGSHGSADYCAHFFRRVAHLIGDHGTVGLIATNTIGQGDTRGTGLQRILADGGMIYEATRSMPWPGEASVAVSVVHVLRGGCALSYRARRLDGFEVAAINSRLRAGYERADPVRLGANAGRGFVGSYVLGTGFVLTSADREALVAKNARNGLRTFPFLGGEEVNTSPTQDFDRYVINFGDLSLEEANKWPDLIAIVREKVKPERDRLNDNADGRRRKSYWWQFGQKTNPALQRDLATVDRCLVTSIVSKHLVFSFQATDRVFSHRLYVFPVDGMGHFGLLQSRLHNAWARLLSSTLEDRLNYSGSDCFETFPFPRDASLMSVAAIGQLVYEFRARFMVETNQGLTTTYNLLKDPDCDIDRIEDIHKLRQLHESLDRVVLDAYGWADIAVPLFCPANDVDRAAIALFEDLVIDRLFALNAERATEERGVFVESSTATPLIAPVRKGPKPRKSRTPENQISMLQDSPREADVIPLHPRGRPVPSTLPWITPAPDMSEVAAGAWTRPRTDHAGEVAAALAAVLRGYEQPADRRQARLAALLCLEPQLLVPMLETAQRKAWTRAVGSEAKRRLDTVMDETANHWGTAVTGLRSRGRLIEDLQSATWGAGTGLDGIDTRGWPDGRASFVLHVLGRTTVSTGLDAIILKLPSLVRELVNRAA